MTTMKDVAKEAGVSLGTVSAVINGSASVKAENVKKVTQACEKLGFVPNLVARTLRTGSSTGIGLLIPDITNPYYPELARGVEDAAFQVGYNVFLCNNDRNEAKERDYVNYLLSKNVDGILMTKPQLSIEELKMVRKRCELVILDPGNTPFQEFDTVVADNITGAREAVASLCRHGHKRIAYVSGSMDSESANERFNGYLQILEENNMIADKQIIKHAGYSWSSGYEAGLELLRESNRPTAIFAANDIIAFGIIKALADNGLLVPRDMSVVGFDDIIMASYSTPSLSSVRMPKYEMGQKSVEILVKRRNERNETRKSSYNESVLARFETEYIERESVSSCP